MPISVDDVLSACTVVAEQEQINVCLSESLKGAGVTGLGAFALGVLMGPIGLAVGGALGGLAASKMCKRYEPLWEIIANMSREDKEKLYYHMLKVIQRLDITDAALLLSLVTTRGVGYRALADGLVGFAQQMSK